MHTQSQSSVSQNRLAFLLALLSGLTAFAPFVTDMYLPSLPSMTTYFNVSTSEVQLGLTTSMVGLAVGQLIAGPLSDKFGRKLPLIVSLVLFVVATVLCLFTTSIYPFVAMRFIQGLGAAGGVVLSRSIATDLYQGRPLAKIMAVIGAISGIAPVLSPVIGGIVLSYTSWQGIFVILLAIGCLLLATTFGFKESYPEDKRETISVMASFTQIKTLCQNRIFMIYTLLQATTMFAFFGQISASPFIFQTHYGFSALAFSGFFATNAIGIALAAGLSVKFKTSQQSLRAGTTLFLISAPLAALSLILGFGPFVYEAFLFLMSASFGLILSPMTALAMNAARKQAGIASAVFGAAGFLSGGIASPLVGLGDITVSSGIVYVFGAVTSFAVICLARKIESNQTNRPSDAPTATNEALPTAASA
ncbi:MAG: multidrug effflux MFS transporter [Proteobacteria bacterium]|nr:multidrug effflux MFS transporter [Pseudomonadota bacterium]